MRKYEYTITGTVEDSENEFEDAEEVKSDIWSCVQADLVTGAANVEVKEVIQGEVFAG